MKNFDKIECLAINNRIDSLDYLRFQHIKTKKEYKIPINQLHDNNIRKDETYSLYKFHNDEGGQDDVSLVYSGFEINETRIFDVKERVTIGSRDFFILKSDLGCRIKVQAYKSQGNLKKINCRIKDYKFGVPILENIDLQNSHYKVNNQYEFEIIRYSCYTDKKERIYNSIIIKDLFGNEISINAKQWQKESLWSFPNLICTVVGHRWDEIPILKNTDTRHPHFEIGQIIQFKIKGYNTRNYQRDKPLMNVIELVDQYECCHDVLLLPNQKDKLEIGDYINCKLEQISNQLHLKQCLIDDPYFYEFTEIIPNLSFKRKYFTSQLDVSFIDVDHLQMKNQYESKSAFYILTFCNKILPKLFREHIERNNYKGAIEINSIIISIEEWILKNGIIQAFPSETTRKNTKEKVKRQIERATIIQNVLPFLSQNNLSKFYKSKKITLQELYYLFLFSNIKLLNALDFIKKIQSINISKSNDDYFLQRFNTVVRNKKREYVDSVEEDFLVLFAKSHSNNNEEFNQFIKWTYFQILILDLLKRSTESNLLKSQLLRYYSSTNISQDKRNESLKYSFHILNNFENKDLKLPIFFEENKISIEFQPLNDQFKFLESNDSWEKIIDAYNNNSYLDVKISKKHINGFEVMFRGVKGFLPSNHITDNLLRKYNLSEISWETRIQISNFSKEFNYFTAAQIPVEDENYISKNKLKTIPILDSIVKGIVTNITDYGIFVSTVYGDGLLHKKYITDKPLQKNDFEKLFKKNSEITLKINNIEKLSFSYIALEDTIYRKEYKEFTEKLDSYLYDVDFGDFESNEKDGFNEYNYIELEKGYIFEQFAASINVLSEKINYIKLAKQFFANHKNARSYLLNIYIHYFKSLIMLNEIIDDYSFEKYEKLKLKFNEVKSRIQPKTLENFSGTDRLIYFINILTLFNETSNDSFDTLYSYIKEYSSKDEELLLNTIAKITLSNNLLLSETIKDENFSLKNLQRINNYIKNGIFTLNESESDRLERELDSKRKYWLDKINQDEGANLEFKSSFITPIPDHKRMSQILALEKKLIDNPDSQAIHDKIDEIKGLKAQKAIMHSALKTIAAFANTSGGYLLLGVADDKTIYGLEEDYGSFKKIEEQSRDGFGKFFDAKLKEYFGDSFSSTLLKKEFLKFPDGDILIIEVRPSTEEVFLLKDDTGNKAEHIFIRNLSSSDKLEGKELAKFIREKYRVQINIATE